MTIEEKVLEAMRKAGEPLNAGKIATLAGIDKKDVEKAMTRLKADGSIVSPKRCFWEPAK
ncbi:MAG: MarR family transcriptional regulator [Prevotellaceae bacterium]|nr:MarR family transcriptional regulator [Prevotellaceae bacterium]